MYEEALSAADVSRVEVQSNPTASGIVPPTSDTAPARVDLSAADVQAMVTALAAATGPDGRGAEADAQRIDLIRALEDLKNAAAGAQTAVIEEFDRSQRAQQVAAGETARRVGAGVAEQVALARRISPRRGRRHLSLARILRTELPCTYRALRAGRITKKSATLMAHGTSCVSREHRSVIDSEIAGEPETIENLGERGVEVAAAKAAYRLDPASAVERRRRAEAERYVSLRPAPDTMTYLTALLPVADGVAVYAALSQAADTARATGAPATRGQIMADTLRDAVVVHEPTVADDDRASDRERPGAPAGVGLVLNVVMSERQLFGSGSASEGEVLIGGPSGGLTAVDADLARQLAALTPAERVWVRRLYTTPDGSELAAIDSTRRRFPPGLQRLIRFRDQECRTPWCHAPIRHSDHVMPAADDGRTTLSNGAGTCEACNYAKEAHGWRVRPSPASENPHLVVTTTPTGHTYSSAPPPPPGGALRTLWSAPRGPLVDIVPSSRAA